MAHAFFYGFSISVNFLPHALRNIQNGVTEKTPLIFALATLFTGSNMAVCIFVSRKKCSEDKYQVCHVTKYSSMFQGLLCIAIGYRDGPGDKND